ncbi:MAG TPA: precorrin-2 C(20)-methyltransferase [Nitrospiria bacterium]|nr:precorrin-2 C(20)-methyltransferase [Nitrospiria bacterium]
MKQGKIQTGKFYGIGVGPGDPELMTIKGLNRLRSAGIICYPACRPGAGSYALRIVENLVEDKSRFMGLLFPMEKEMERLLPVWKESVETIHQKLREGTDVAFITEGDPFFYSTFVYLFRLMRELHPEVEIEVVPAVSSITACAVRAGVPLAMADERVAVLPATYEKEFLRDALRHFDTVVFLKVSSVLPALVSLLEEMDLIDRAVLVEKCGSPEERLVRDLRSVKDERFNYLSLVIVRKEGR